MQTPVKAIEVACVARASGESLIYDGRGRIWPLERQDDPHGMSFILFLDVPLSFPFMWGHDGPNSRGRVKLHLSGSTAEGSKGTLQVGPQGLETKIAWCLQSSTPTLSQSTVAGTVSGHSTYELFITR